MHVSITSGIATGYGLDGRSSILNRDRDFSLLHSVQTDSRAHLAAYPVGTGSSFRGVKLPGREAYHSPPSCAEVKNGGCIPTLLDSLHGAVLN
jgi:hypothetical protein